MLIEQLIFIIVAFVLFIYVFYQLIRKNDTKYVPILAIQALGIAIDFIELYFKNEESNLTTKLIIYTLSIIIPMIILGLEELNIDILEGLKIKIAKLYFMSGNIKKAKNILIKLVTQHPENHLGHKLLGQIYEKEGGQRKAVDEYAQAIDINKHDYESYYRIANLLIDLDKKDEAADMLTNLLSKKSDYVEATIKLGDLLIEKEDFKEAANIYLEALKANPVSFDLNYNLGIVYTMLNDFQNARMYYEKAAELNTMIYNTKYSLAEIAVIYKEIEEAEEYFLQATEDEELCADAYLELAKIYLIKGDKEQAIKYANVAIQEEPKRIVQKIQKDVAFAVIISKLSIPFNLDIEDEEKKKKLTAKELMAKRHLEGMAEITKKIGYNNIKIEKREKEDNQQEKIQHKQKERE
ncbi:MAG: tetratricopeptide repeat protein [Clostridia bacterium]|nr:tetratricopeptide repeat protein [Clostridia bacterium]